MIIYRTTGDWGPGKGARLTKEDVDGNFWDIDGRLTAIEDDPPAAIGISSITMTTNLLTIALSDGTTFGPFTVPQAPFRPAAVAALAAATFTPSAATMNTYQRCTNAGGCVVTLPNDAAIPVDAEFTFRQAAAGYVSFVGESDVAVNGQAGCIDETAGQGSVVTAKKVGAAEWDLVGHLMQDVSA